jgi:hypothetical protein
MHVLSLRCLLLLIPIFIPTIRADDAEVSQLCGDLKNPFWKVAHDLGWCDVEEPKHRGKGPQCRPGITTCKDREHRCCNDFVCELMCDPDEDDDEHEDGHACGGEGDKECSCRHTCETHQDAEGNWKGKCQQKPSFAIGKDDNSVCIMEAAKHNNGTSKPSMKAPTRPLNTTMISGFNTSKERANATTISSAKAPGKYDNSTTSPKSPEQHASGTRKASPRKPLRKGKPNPLTKSGTNSLRRQSSDLDSESLDAKYGLCNVFRRLDVVCKSANETCVRRPREECEPEKTGCTKLADEPGICIG